MGTVLIVDTLQNPVASTRRVPEGRSTSRDNVCADMQVRFVVALTVH
jgi:hypothetical protein